MSAIKKNEKGKGERGRGRMGGMEGGGEREREDGRDGMRGREREGGWEGVTGINLNFIYLILDLEICHNLIHLLVWCLFNCNEMYDYK